MDQLPSEFREKLLSLRKIVLDDRLLSLIGPERTPEAEENANHLDAFVFGYEVRGQRYDGFLVRPRSVREAPLPVIIFNRGGTGEFGSVKIGRFFQGMIARLVRAGYAVIGSQRMGFGDGGARDEVGGEDFHSVLALYDLIALDHSLDGTRIGLYGGSRGGATVWRLLAANKPARAAVIVSGMADYIDTAFRPQMEDHFKKVFGGTLEERQKRSVLSWPEKLPKNVPMLLMYGTSDWRVDPRSGLELSKRCVELHIPHRFVMFEGNDHRLSKNKLEADALTLQWFDRFVKNDGPLPNMLSHGE